MITSLNQYMIIVGTALSAAIGYLLAFTGSWRWMLLLGVFPAVVLMVGMIAMSMLSLWLIAQPMFMRTADL